MNTPQFIPPVTLEEFRFKFKLTLGKMKKDTKIEYSVVQLHNQFKVVGLITKSPFISTFTIDFAPDIPRRFVECDMPALVLSIKNNFYAFMQSSHNYATPYGNHTEQTVFFYLVQMHIKIMDTISYVPQQQNQFLEFSWCLTFTITRAHNLPCPTYSCTVTSTTTTPLSHPCPTTNSF